MRKQAMRCTARSQYVEYMICGLALDISLRNVNPADIPCVSRERETHNIPPGTAFIEILRRILYENKESLVRFARRRRGSGELHFNIVSPIEVERFLFQFAHVLGERSEGNVFIVNKLRASGVEERTEGVHFVGFAIYLQA